MKCARPALAALALTLAGGCGGGLSPQGLVDQLMGQGHQCERLITYSESTGVSEDVVDQCNPNGEDSGGALAFVYDSREELLGNPMPPEVVQELKRVPAIFKSQDAMVDDLSYPYWEILCLDRKWVDAGRQLDWLEINA